MYVSRSTQTTGGPPRIGGVSLLVLPEFDRACALFGLPRPSLLLGSQLAEYHDWSTRNETEYLLWSAQTAGGVSLLVRPESGRVSVSVCPQLVEYHDWSTQNETEYLFWSAQTADGVSQLVRPESGRVSVWVCTQRAEYHDWSTLNAILWSAQTAGGVCPNS